MEFTPFPKNSDLAFRRTLLICHNPEAGEIRPMDPEFRSDLQHSMGA